MTDPRIPIPPQLGREEQKQLVKDALKEWLDEKWSALGKWSAKGIAAMILSALAYLWLTQHGWRS